jgi:hypothetical protein
MDFSRRSFHSQCHRLYGTALPARILTISLIPHTQFYSNSEIKVGGKDKNKGNEVSMKAYTSLDRPLGVQQDEAPRISINRYMKVARLTDRPPLPQ